MRHDYGEARRCGLGYIGQRLYAVAFVERTEGRDPDAKPLTEAEWQAAKPHARIGRPPKPDAKVAVKLRLDPDDWPC